MLKTIEGEINLLILEKDQLQILLQRLRKLLPLPPSSPHAMDWGYIRSVRICFIYSMHSLDASQSLF